MATDLERLKEGARLAQEGRYDEALSALERLLIDTPDDPDVLFMIGACYYKQGNTREARQNWEKVLQIDPAHAKAQGMLDNLAGAESQAGAKPLTEAQKAVAEKAAKKKPQKKAGKPWLKWAVFGAVPVVLILLVLDMLSNPQSYPFLGREKNETEAPPQEGAAPVYEDPAKRPVPLETGLPGRWYFKWEGDPTTLTFHGNGNMNVIRNMQGGLKLAMQGTYRVEGDNLIFNLTYKDPTGIEATDEVTMYNAKIEGVNLTFNFLAPDGPGTLAVKQ